METRCWERKGKTRAGKDGANFSVNIETPLEGSWRTFLLREGHVGPGTDSFSLLLEALHPSLDPTLAFPTQGPSVLLPAQGREKDHVGNALNHMREGPWNDRPNAGSFVLPEWLKLLRENSLPGWWESPQQKVGTRCWYVTVWILHGAEALLSLIRCTICIEEITFNKKRKGKRWDKKRKNQGE